MHFDVRELRPGGPSIPQDCPDRVRAADPGDRSIGLVEHQSGVDSAHSIDKGDHRDSVVATIDRLPGTILDRDVDRPFGGADPLIGLDGRAVLG